jgi:hypothetical protein
VRTSGDTERDDGDLLVPPDPRRVLHQEIVEAARARMGRERDVFYAPGIPPFKLAAARAAHEAYLPEHERVLVLYDGTLLGSADNGFVVTAERLCWKNLFEHPRQIAWSEVDPASIVPDVGRVAIAGGSIVTSGDLAPHAARFLVEMASRARRDAGGPYRRAEDAAEDERAAVARLAAICRRQLGEVEDLHYHPAIPPKKLLRARAAHSAWLPADEGVAVLYDDTLFGGAEEGFLLTAHRLCYKNLSSSPASVAWVDLDPSRISLERSTVFVPGGALLFTAQGELAAPVAALLGRLAAEARRGLVR